MGHPVPTVALQSLKVVLRDKGIVLIAALFALMVGISAWLGWAATQTVNEIYLQAVDYLNANNQPVPPNPVSEGAPLSVLRNLTVYISFLGTFAAIVIGQSLIELDRRAGVLPLTSVRPISATQFALGKMTALASAIAALVGIAGSVSVITLLGLPALQLGATEWLNLFSALLVGWAYMFLFGCVALGFAALLPAVSSGLLAATILWLSVTFVLPAVTGNVNPTAAINPVSALSSVPDTTFFNLTSKILGPLSLSESFGWVSAKLMGYLPIGMAPRGGLVALFTLPVAFAASGAFALHSLKSLDPNIGGPDA